MGGKREGGGEATRRRSRGKEERRSGSGGHKNGRRWENAPNGPSGNLSQNGVLLFRCFALSLFRCFALSVFRCFAFSLSPHQEKSPSTRALRAEPARLYSTFNTLSFLVPRSSVLALRPLHLGPRRRHHRRHRDRDLEIAIRKHISHLLARAARAALSLYA